MECRVLAILSPTSIWVVVAARNDAVKRGRASLTSLDHSLPERIRTTGAVKIRSGWPEPLRASWLAAPTVEIVFGASGEKLMVGDPIALSDQYYLKRAHTLVLRLWTQPRKGLEPMKKDDLVIPTDVAALLFGVLIFSVAIFALNRRFLVDPDTYWHIATGNWILAEHAFPNESDGCHPESCTR